MNGKWVVSSTMRICIELLALSEPQFKGDQRHGKAKLVLIESLPGLVYSFVFHLDTI